MKHLDDDIEQVENRIARRRQELESTARETAQYTKRKLSSPAVLAGVAALGFLAGGGLRRKPREHYPDRRKASASATKKTGIAGLLMTGAMWLIKSQIGNPAAIASFVLSRMKKGSPRGDSRTAQFYR